MAEAHSSSSSFPHRMVSLLGQTSLGAAEAFGRVTILWRQTARWLAFAERRLVFQQMAEVGANSFWVTGMTALFTGMVLALQTGFSFRKTFNEPLFVGTIVGMSMVKELGPVLTSVVVAGRIGAAIAAELGSMKVTEQIDALYTLGTHPVKYLAIPRFLACLTMIPILALFSDFMGVLGGFAVAILRLDVPSTTYWEEIRSLTWEPVTHGLMKSFFFALFIVSTACYQGFHCEGGAAGVGRATTQAVVISIVAILIGDYFLSALLVAFGIG